MLYEIHRYPAELIDVIHVVRGDRSERVVIRPVLPQDDAPTAAFFASLSGETRRARFLSPIREIAPGLIARFTNVDYSGHMALVAEVFEDGVETVIAEARYVRDASGRCAEFAVTVAEAWQGHGLARRLLAKLACHAARAGVQRLIGETMANNGPMLYLARKGGFVLSPDPEQRDLVRLERHLAPSHQGRPCGAAT